MRAHLEPIALTETTSLYIRNVVEPHFNHPLHYHPEIELTYIARSKGTRLIGDHIGYFDEGNLCLIGSKLPHLYTNTIRPPQGAQAEVLQFDRGFSNGFIDATPELLPFAKLIERADLGITFDKQTAQACGQLMRELRQAHGVTRIRLFMDIIECLISARQAHTLASPGYTGASTTLDSERMQVACQYILDHFTEEIDHQTLAAKVHLAPTSFCRLFKRVTRKTCTTFVNEIRLGHACRLLMESEASITEIAFNCGFRNLSNFNRRFRDHYLCSPREYRKQKLMR